MNIAYLLYREDIFSPLVEGQVLNVLKNILDEKCSIHFIWLKRADYCFKHQEKIAPVRDKLYKDGIVLHEIPIIVGKFPLAKSMFDFVYNQVSGKIRKILKENNIDILHTRGYNAGLLATRLLKNGMHTKHIFDPRSPYLTEIVSTYGVKEGDNKYKYWEKNEKEIVNSSNATIAISDTFYKYLRSLGGNIIVIPNNSEMDKPEKVITRAKEQRRNSFCFVGSLGYGWNNVLEYIAFMQNIWKLNADIKLELYVLKQDIVKEELNKAGIPNNRYIIKTLPQSEVGKTISGCLAGLQIMSKPDTRLGIKTVDYLSAGVPVICNNNAMGAANVVDRFEVGWNINNINLEELVTAVGDETLVCRCANVAYNNFSTKVVSDKYYKLYESLSKKGK